MTISNKRIFIKYISYYYYYYSLTMNSIRMDSNSAPAQNVLIYL